MRLIKYSGLFILSVLITFLVSVIDAILRNQLVAGFVGIPLRFSDVSLFGGGETNIVNLILDFIFWFLILWLVWKYWLKIFKKR